MEQVTGFEPVSSAWQAEILTIILYLHIGPGVDRTLDSLDLHMPKRFHKFTPWSRRQESNLQPTDYKSVALPVAPRRHISFPRIRTLLVPITYAKWRAH